MASQKSPKSIAASKSKDLTKSVNLQAGEPDDIVSDFVVPNVTPVVDATVVAGINTEINSRIW